MSIFKLNKDLFESTQLELNPSRTFISSSIGTTGSINLFSNKSSKIIDLKFSNEFRLKLDNSLKNNIEEYFQTVSQSSIYNKEFYKEISLNSPGKTINSSSMDKDSRNSYFKKSLENLNDFYKVENPYYSYSTSNYFSLNFFSIDDDPNPNDRSLVYLTPSLNRKYSDVYDLEFIDDSIKNTEITPFTLDFYINPRYTNQSGSYTPGTIFHIPNIITLSLIDGNNYDNNNLINNFKLLLQIGSDTLNTPTQFLTGTYTVTSSNSLEKDHWHRVSVRWGGSFINSSTGSIYIDDLFDTSFYYPGNIIGSGSYYMNDVMPIMIGNYSNSNLLKNFFNQNNVSKGVTGWFTTSNPTITCNNQLNAELHHILFSRKYYIDSELFDFSNQLKVINKTFDNITDSLLVSGSFYNQNSNLEINNFFNSKDHDILYVIPSFWYKCKKNDEFKNQLINQVHPYNLYASYTYGVHNLNVENFVLNFASRLIDKSLPYLNGYNITKFEDDDLFFNDLNNRLKNLLILPCDDGNFIHSSKFIDYEIEHQVNINKVLKQNSIDQSISYDKIYDKSFKETLNVLKRIYSNNEFEFESGIISLKNNIRFTKEIKDFDISGSYLEIGDIENFPKISQLTTGDFSIYKNTSYDIYNDFKFLDVSNIFYGNNINENSLEIKEDSYLGISKIKMTLKDNGEGVLYRADSKTKNAKWAKVGNLYKNEGFITILSPALHRFGKNDFSLSFEGKQNVFIYKVSAILPGGKVNKSVNKSWQKAEENKEFVYITDVNLHDNNYNIVMKAKLAQPIYKGKNDKFMIRLKYDF